MVRDSKSRDIDPNMQGRRRYSFPDIPWKKKFVNDEFFIFPTTFCILPFPLIPGTANETSSHTCNRFNIFS